VVASGSSWSSLGDEFPVFFLGGGGGVGVVWGLGMLIVKGVGGSKRSCEGNCCGSSDNGVGVDVLPKIRSCAFCTALAIRWLSMSTITMVYQRARGVLIN